MLGVYLIGKAMAKGSSAKRLEGPSACLHDPLPRSDMISKWWVFHIYVRGGYIVYITSK